MTDDLIRARLDANATAGYCADAGLNDALRAVLDLHKIYRRRPGGDPYCDECDDSEGYLVPWPCPTVQTIAGALGVDLT